MPNSDPRSGSFSTDGWGTQRRPKPRSCDASLPASRRTFRSPHARRGRSSSRCERRSPLSHNYIGTEHILLGLVRENEGVAARILLDFAADSEKIRNEVIRMLSGPGGRQGSGGQR